MRIYKQKAIGRKRTVALIMAAAILVVCLGYLGYAWHSSSFPFSNNQPVDNPNNTVDLESPTQPQQDAGTRAKQDFIQQHEQVEDKPGSSDGSGGATAKPTSLVITSNNQEAEVYRLRTMIDTVDGSGTCTLAMQSDKGAIHEQSVGTQNLGSYSVCKGFDIPTAGLEKGAWTAVIEYKGSAGQAVSTQKKIEVK